MKIQKREILFYPRGRSAELNFSRRDQTAELYILSIYHRRHLPAVLLNFRIIFRRKSPWYNSLENLSPTNKIMTTDLLTGTVKGPGELPHEYFNSEAGKLTRLDEFIDRWKNGE